MSKTVIGWVFEENARPLCQLLSSYVEYGFDGSDWEAIEMGIEATDDEANGHWYTYPLIGSERVDIRLTRSGGTGVVMVEIELPDDRPELAVRAETLLDAFATSRE